MIKQAYAAGVYTALKQAGLKEAVFGVGFSPSGLLRGVAEHGMETAGNWAKAHPRAAMAAVGGAGGAIGGADAAGPDNRLRGALAGGAVGAGAGALAGHLTGGMGAVQQHLADGNVMPAVGLGAGALATGIGARVAGNQAQREQTPIEKLKGMVGMGPRPRSMTRSIMGPGFGE